MIQKCVLGRLGASWRRLSSSWGVLGASWGAPGPSWSVLGASRRRLGPVLGASGAVLGASSSILCSSWGVLWILCGKAFENQRFYVRISNPEPLKIKPPLQREHDLRDFEIFENNLPFGSILVPTWLHFGSIFRVLGRLGRLLGRLGASWGRLGAVLGRLKIDVKIDQKINAFQDRFLMQFWWILGGKMEASWH